MKRITRRTRVHGTVLSIEADGLAHDASCAACNGGQFLAVDAYVRTVGDLAAALAERGVVADGDDTKAAVAALAPCALASLGLTEG